MSFLNSPRFPECISFGSAGGPAYNTTLIELGSGQIVANQNWELPKRYYDVAYGVKRLSDLEDLIDFFHAVRGSFHTFRYKDWTDFKTSHTQETPAFDDSVIGEGDGTTTVFQLKKTYTQGALVQSADIVAPVSGTGLIGINGVQQFAGFTINYTNGEVTFSSPPANGADITAGFEFDVRVRFESDRLSVILSQYLAGEASVKLVEDR